jgi:hypothetical protein
VPREPLPGESAPVPGAPPVPLEPVVVEGRPVREVLRDLRARPPAEAIPVLQRMRDSLRARVDGLNTRIRSITRAITERLERATRQTGRERARTTQEATDRMQTRTTLEQERMVLERELADTTRELEVADLRANPDRRGALPCFAAGTPVWTPDGPRPIESLRKGDLVLSADPENGAVRPRRVTAAHRARTAHWIHLRAGGMEIRATGRHRFWRPGAGWTDAAELRAGMTLLGVDGSPVAVDAAERRPADEATYNLSVEHTPTYFVGPGVLVHNQGSANHGMGPVTIYVGTNPAFPGQVYVGQTVQTLGERQAQHRLEGINGLAEPGGGGAQRDFYEFKRNMTIVEVVRGVAVEYADYVEQRNIDIEVQIRGEANVMNRREQARNVRMREMAEAAARDPRVIEAGLCPG